MRIRIQLDDLDPPVGTASRARAAVPFIGWLELLNAIRLLLDGRPTGVADGKSSDGSDEAPHAVSVALNAADGGGR